MLDALQVMCWGEHADTPVPIAKENGSGTVWGLYTSGTLQGRFCQILQDEASKADTICCLHRCLTVLFLCHSSWALFSNTTQLPTWWGHLIGLH